MKPPRNSVPVNILSSFCLIALLGIVSCASQTTLTPLPDCNYTTHISTNEQVKDFIWRDKKHAAFNEDWLLSSLIEISNRYQYLQRKSLPDAVKAENDILWLEAKLNNLIAINNSLLVQIETNLCNNQQGIKSPSELKKQNEGIALMLSGLPDIYNDIEAKKKKIIDAIESK